MSRKAKIVFDVFEFAVWSTFIAWICFLVIDAMVTTTGG